jgi:hypothetical protein
MSLVPELIVFIPGTLKLHTSYRLFLKLIIGKALVKHIGYHTSKQDIFLSIV